MRSIKTFNLWLAAVALASLAVTNDAHAQPAAGFWPTGGQGIYSVSADGRVAVGNDGTRGSFRWTRAGGREYLNPDQVTFYTAISADAETYADQLVSGPGVNFGFRQLANGPIQPLPNPPGNPRGFAHEVNSNGTVLVGYSQRGPNTNSAGVAWRWTAETGTQELGFLPFAGPYAEARAVSADGTIVVGFNGGGGRNAAFRWDTTVGLTELAALSGTTQEASAVDISADGRVVVGTSYDGQAIAVRWVDEGLPERLPRIAGFAAAQSMACSGDGSVVFGSVSGLRRDVFVWTEATGSILLRDYAALFGVVVPAGVTFTSADDVSDDGLTFVGSASFGGRGQGFILTVPSPAGFAVFAFVLVIPRRRPTVS